MNLNWINIYLFTFNKINYSLINTLKSNFYIFQSNIIKSQLKTPPKKSPFKLKELKSFLLRDNFEVLTPAKLILSNNHINFFILYLNLLETTGTPLYFIHAYHKTFFISPTQGAPYINISKLFLKFNQFISFIYNVFYYNTFLVIFSNKTLKREVASFNWLFFNKNYLVFRRFIPYFMLKNNSYGNDESSLYTQIVTNGVETAFVLDTKSHYRNLAFLRKKNVYTFGLISYNTNPWLVHYPIIIGSSTLFTQYFFIKTLLYLKQEARYKFYNNLISK